MGGVTKESILSSLFWKLLERGGAQGVQLFVMIILARLLIPEDFGLIVLIGIFITIAGVIVESGLTTALIQNKQVDALDYSSVFYFNICLALLLYIGIFFTAPFAAKFFEEAQMVLILRVLSLTLFFNAFQSIQNAIISKNLQFKKLFISSFGASIVSGVVGISTAFANFGAWSLVAQQLTQQVLLTLILCLTVRWRPLWCFSISRIKKLYSIGWKLALSVVIDTFYNNLRSVFIGKLFNPGLLGFYYKGEEFPRFLVNNINGSIQSVMLPALASYQDNRKKMKEMVRRSIVTSSFMIFPMMVGLSAIAEPLVKVLLTEKWLPSVPFLQIFCAVYALWPIHTANLQAINAIGRTDIFLKLELIKKIIGLSILLFSIQFGVHAIAMGSVISGVISTYINSFPNRKLFNYSFREQWLDILPSLTISFIMGSVVYGILWMNFPPIFTVILQIVVGIVLYIGLAKLFKLEAFHYLWATLKTLLLNRKKTNLIPGNEV